MRVDVRKGEYFLLWPIWLWQLPPIRMVHWLFRFPLISISYVPVLQEIFFMLRLMNAIPAVVQDVIR